MSATKVAIAGATGNLGPAVLKELKEAGFELTVLTRSAKDAFGSDVRVAQVDYSSIDSLQAALEGQDALAAALPVYADKVAVQKRLEEVAAAPGNPEVYDGGDRKFSATTLSGIGKAVAGVLKDLDSTRNKTVFVQSARITQNELLRMAGKEQVPKKEVRTADLEKKAFEELQKPNPNHRVFALNLLRRALFGEGYGGLLSEENLWNDALGVPKLSEAEVAAIVSQYA
ncbi:predicted protein [Aspergillus terreus NIH2624]|uniref:NAD(P)-binding domain-containing protein n=1 Tax=Aspergillus terreus (strain NIH 2624 / FGSC A1156) TaxID=341663 RepID=Q0CM08_ASPTN|nr:uncharacterized protein ATEG_05276 [Aspergillus terreus NIH2624]EAU34345.1 predicted protein [Aspergillus terreus NIH2624]